MKLAPIEFNNNYKTASVDFNNKKAHKAENKPVAFKRMPEVFPIKTGGKLTGFINRFKNVDGWVQRGIMGATAIFTQPFIDRNNKRVDEDTRKFSTLRTVIKIIVGATVGMAVRYAALEGSRKFLGASFAKFKEKAKDTNLNKIAKLLMPEGSSKNVLLSDETRYKKYVSHMATCIGVAASLFTNFLIDMPLTKFLTTHFAQKFGLSNKKTAADKEKTAPANNSVNKFAIREEAA